MPMKPAGGPARLAREMEGRSTAMTYSDAVRRFSRGSLLAAARAGAVTRLLPGVYVAASQIADPLVRLRAVSAWLGRRGAVTGAAALALWEYRDEHPGRVTVQVRPSLHLVAPSWIHVVRPTCLTDYYRVKGVRVVDAPLAVVQAWNERVGGDGVSVVVEAVKRGMHRDKIAAAAAALPRVRARAKLAELLALLDGGVKSYLEWIARSKVFTVERFPHLIWQPRIMCRGRARYPDAYDPEAKIDLEFDGAGTHSTEADRRRDLERDADFASIGIQSLHFTMEDLLYRPQWCIERYLETRAARIGS